MRNILIIARKELLSTFRQRNTLFVMFLSPILLVSIIGLAFGGLGRDSGTPDFAPIRVAVVNLDQGFDLQSSLPASATNPSLADLKLEAGGQTIPLGDELLQNPQLGLASNGFASGAFTMNFGNQLSAILLSQPLTATSVVSGMGAGFDLSALTCPLLPADQQGLAAYDGTLADILDAEAVTDTAEARAGVTSGKYAAAVIIPPDFSRQLTPDFGLGSADTRAAITSTKSMTTTGLVEVVANNGTAISASIVRSNVESIVSQFERVNVAINALGATVIDRLNALEVADLAGVDSSRLDLSVITRTIQNADLSVVAPLGCLFTPEANNIHVEQRALDRSQEGSPFRMLIVTMGAAQAIFFALFTGVFGINSIYEDRRQGTLQRVLASPTTSTQVLFGRLLGNLVIVMCQLIILLGAFTVIASIVEREVTFIWGTNFPALLLIIAGLSLFTTGMGVLIVGLADSSEQVQLIGPIVTIIIGGLGGIFGAVVPPALAHFSPTWWGIDAMHKLSANQSDIALNVVVLFGCGALFAVVGTIFFRRRMGL